jgi:RsmE family RNA methyltransferase
MLLGLEQSCDTILPQVHFKRKFKAFVEDELKGITDGSIGITAHPSAENICPAGLDQRVTLCIGPEGGFIDSEIDMLAQNSCPAFRLGVSRPLRTEFALCALLGRLF